LEKGVIWTPFFQYVRLDCGDISKHGDLKESPPNLTSYEKSKHFYVDLLGFKVIRENYRKERDDYKIDLACGTQEIELFIIKNAPAEYSCAMKSHFRKFGNQMSGSGNHLCNYASLLA